MAGRFVQFGSLFALLFLGIRLFAQPASEAADAADRKALLTGVKEIAFPGVPGTVVAFGEQAFPLVAGSANKEPALVVAGGRLGKGRVVILGHEGYLAVESVKKGDTQRLLENAIRWVGRNEQPTVAVVEFKATAQVLAGNGLKAVSVPRAAGLEKTLASQVVLMSAGDIQAADVPRLRRWIENGGGLITGIPGWGWEQVHRGKTLARDCPAQQLLAGAGLGFAGDTLTRPASGMLTVSEPAPQTHVRQALKIADSTLAGRMVPPAEASLAQATLVRALTALPEADVQPLFERLKTALANAKTASPAPDRPLRKKDAEARLAVGLRNRLLESLPPEQIEPAPGADAFPGSVPKEAARITKKVTVVTGTKGTICDGVGTSAGVDLWTGTGLYAAPGEVLTVTVPPDLVGKGFQVQIGCHSDTLWHLDSWQRYPNIVTRKPLAQAQVRIASAFGGLVYITAPVKAAPGSHEVTIAGAVAAPLYVHGKTTREEWARIRNAPGPWAEFACDKVILTVPTADARKVADPVELMNFWERVLDACADLSAVSRERGRAERLVHDVQISAGYMHSGYPIMGPINEGRRALDIARIQREGAWGFFHELGHNHQGRAWTFDGTVEVTCNLYSLYVTETLCPKAPLHEAIQPAAIRQHARKYRMAGAPFDDWKKDPFTALIVYKQMQEAFGWDTFKKVFSEYQKALAGELPRNDAEKRDQWLVRFSKACGKNLTPAFDFWGIPVSDTAKKAVANLPGWVPPDATK